MTSEIRNLQTPTSEFRVRVHGENRGTERPSRWALVTAYPVRWDRVTRDEVDPYPVGLEPVTRDEGRHAVVDDPPRIGEPTDRPVQAESWGW